MPWYIAVQRENPTFFREFFLEHNLNRFATNRFQHRQHFWYYIPVFLAGTLPWTLFVLAGLVRGLKSLRASREEALGAFLAVWVVVPVVFFSISQSKLPGYILPAIAPCGLLVAIYLGRKDDAVSPVFTAIHALVCGAVLTTAMVAPYKLYRIAIPAPVLRLVIPLGLIVAVGVAVVVWLRGYEVLRVATLVPLAIAVAFMLKPAAPAIDATQSARPIADRIGTTFAAHDPILLYDVPRGVQYGLAFYLDRPLPEAPSDEIVKFGTAAAGTQPREKILKDISNTLPPSHGNYLLVTRTGAVDRFVGGVPPNYQVEPFFRFLPQHLDLYYLRDVARAR
jgi:4-amino-4-deoxy-L-arabinose transferase-like glycosyltransferase